MDAAWPRLTIKPSNQQGVPTFDQLPPGKYRVVAHQRAPRWDGLQYEMPDDARPIEVVAGETKDLQVQLTPRPLTDEILLREFPGS